MSRGLKRAIGAAVALLLAGTLAGCSQAGPNAEARSVAEGGAPAASTGDRRPLVLATFTVIADIAQQVAGPHLRVESLTKPGTEIHGYEPTPGDLRRAAEAELILDNGMGLEAWFEQFVAGIDAPHTMVSQGVRPIDIAADAYRGLPNPHAWMSPLNAQLYVDNMAAAFSRLDPQHAPEFAANAEAYKSELQRVHDELLAELAEVPAAQRSLVTCEGAFSYLARDAGLDEAYIWAVNAEKQATPRQIASVIDLVRERQVPAVFCESTVSDAPMQRVVESSDAVFGGTLYVDSLSQPDGPVPSYLELLRHNARTIAEGLTR